MATRVDPTLRRYVSAVTRAASSQGLVIGSYLHGSGALGGFRTQHSDVDLLLVLADTTSRAVAEDVARAVAAVDGCPGVGLELSAVTRSAAVAPAAPWPFLLHVTTEPGDRKIVLGSEGEGDPDLALHYAVVRDHGWTALGPAPAELVGAVARSVLLERLAEELRWGVANASMQYAVLNAARALRFAATAVLCSKTAGGEWALAQGEPADVIGPALAAQRGSSPPAHLTPIQTDWVRHAVARLRLAEHQADRDSG
jgi:Domain of unknown function (DUF4111)